MEIVYVACFALRHYCDMARDLYINYYMLDTRRHYQNNEHYTVEDRSYSSCILFTIIMNQLYSGVMEDTGRRCEIQRKTKINIYGHHQKRHDGEEEWADGRQHS